MISIKHMFFDTRDNMGVNNSSAKTVFSCLYKVKIKSVPKATDLNLKGHSISHPRQFCWREFVDMMALHVPYSSLAKFIFREKWFAISVQIAF